MATAVKKEKTKNRFNQNYAQIIPFLRRKFTPLEFESYCGAKLNLFAIDSNFDFDNVEKTADLVLKCLPSMKRIFAKPLIDLIDINNVIPVESIRKINSKTIEYSINHPQTIGDIDDDDQVKPKKLLSTEYKLLYETYENQTFTYLVNLLLKYAKRNLLSLNNYLFLNNDEINVNVLERNHHSDYYLAIGQLHTSYIRNFTKSLNDVLRLISKLRQIYDTLSARTNSRVYVLCNKIKHEGKRYRLKKTNIFRNQKDYRRIYNVLHYFMLNYDKLMEDEYKSYDIANFEKPYYHYCLILLTFSMLRFNFIIQKTSHLNFNKFDQNFRFKKFRCNIKKTSINKINYISITFSKEKDYHIVAYCGYDPMIAHDELIKLKKLVPADEYMIFTPYTSFEDGLYISVNNIDSFRRLQQMFLRAMIYSDGKFDTCPFCGEPLTKRKEGSKFVYECGTCHTLIKEKTCPKKKRKYYSTSIKNYHKIISELKEDKKEIWIHSHDIETQMYFRNINKLNASMEEICPICGELHDTK